MSSSASSPTTSSTCRVPSLVVFDLDFTVWFPEMYELAGAPFRRCKKSGRVMDRAGEIIHVFPDFPKIWKDIHTKYPNMKIAVASSTTHPQWAQRCLELLPMDPIANTLHEGIEYREMYPRNKRNHFREIQKESGIPYEEMLFFDNEYYNIDSVSPLGVTCIYCPEGMTWRHWEDGIRAFQEKED